MGTVEICSCPHRTGGIRIFRNSNGITASYTNECSICSKPSWLEKIITKLFGLKYLNEIPLRYK